MKNSTNSTDSKTDSTPNDQTQTTTTTEDTSTDDFGYAVDEKTKVDPPADKTEEKKEEVKVENPVTGYGDDKTKVDPPADKTEEKKEEKKPEDMTDEEKAAKEISDAVKALGDNPTAEKIKNFAIENKMTKAQVDAYVNMTKQEEAQAVKAQKEFVEEQRKTWKKELKEDPDFGGEQFDLNVSRVEKLLASNMPNTKKILTERGSMMPPYIMKDLLSLAKALNPTTNFVGGEPGEPKKEEKNFLDDLYS